MNKEMKHTEMHRYKDIKMGIEKYIYIYIFKIEKQNSTDIK
jgi:hypothetical protein